jgi:phosphatidylserine decarboxylase
MRLAPEGWPFIRIALSLEIALLIVGWAFPGWPTRILAAIGLALLAWQLVFFRDPERTGPRGDALVIAPADGRVLRIVEVEEPMYLHGTATRISIFMNIFNVHVNRYPVAGEVEIVHYNPGEFLVASEDKASLVNEQSSTGILCPRGQVLVRQIAGMVARRIVTDAEPGMVVRQGDRLGMIRFGSRVDVFLDSAVTVRVAEGQHVFAGETVIAEFAT